MGPDLGLWESVDYSRAASEPVVAGDLAIGDVSSVEYLGFTYSSWDVSVCSDLLHAYAADVATVMTFDLLL